MVREFADAKVAPLAKRIDVDLRPWGGAWATHDVGILASGAQNAAQVLILLDPSPESRAQARQEAPGIPQNYQPA